MLFNTDYSNVQDFSPVKPGEYEATVISAVKKSASTGSQMLVVDYEIRSDVEQEEQGKKVKFDNFVLTPATQWRFMSILSAVGVPEGVKIDTMDEVKNLILNKNLILVVDNEARNGKLYAVASGYKPSKQAEALSDDEPTGDGLPF